MSKYDKFLEGFSNKSNIAYTENQATMRKTTNSALLDFFGQGGAMRDREETAIQRLFDLAMDEQKELAVKMAFYFRDVRGGQGERDVFKSILKHLVQVEPDVIRKNLAEIPYYGRWDDLYALFDTPLEEEVAEFMHDQIIEDLNSDNPSLCAKWLKSENASSSETKRLAKKTRKHFGWTPKNYRKTLSKLRKQIGVVERKMSNNNWEEIKYENVPSKASMIYNDAFRRHDPEGYEDFLNKVESGEVEVNASTLYPYELVRRADKKFLDFWGDRDGTSQERRLLNEQWKALPDYIEGKDSDAIAVVDTSASMESNEGLPKYVALSLGLYMAERASGPFHNKFITFSARPEMIKVSGSDFVSRINNMWGAHWDMNTDIKAVFEMILQTALDNNLSQDEIPARLIIISDMQFDRSAGHPDKTLFEKIDNMYSTYGYNMPQLVFWNVDAKRETFPMKKDERGFQLVSGFSPVIFEHVMKDEFLSPMQLLIDTVDAERYSRVTI